MQLQNGVDVDGLRDTIDAIEANPSVAKSRFRVSNQWIDGGHNQIRVGRYYAAGADHDHQCSCSFEAGEPTELLGNDEGANPVEYLLAALSGCMTSTIVYHAAAKGVKIDALRSEFVGDLDLRGFLNLSEEVPVGYQKIEVVFYVKMKGDLSEITDLYRYSPVYSMVSASVPVEVTWEKE